jgi:hypothetical protein
MLSLSNRHVGGRRTHACHVAVPGLIHPRSQQSRSSKPRLATTNQGSRRTTVARRCVSAALTAPRPVRLERAFPSHGRGRRFETCYAHHPSPQVNPTSRVAGQAPWLVFGCLGPYLVHMSDVQPRFMVDTVAPVAG